MAWTPTGGGDHSGADWTISAPTTIGGIHTNVGQFTLDSGITATLLSESVTEVHSVNAALYGTIDGDAKGYVGGAASASGFIAYDGTGVGYGHKGSIQWGGGGGAGYGDAGGNGWDSGAGSVGGIAYDTSSDYVLSLGSGGGGGNHLNFDSGGGGDGGGAFGIYSGYIYIDAVAIISCDGGASDGSASGGGGGGGSGGSILLSGYVVDNYGTLTAIGGLATSTTIRGGGGAGGRIKQFYGSSIADTSTKTVTGGVGYNNGGIGSTYSTYRQSDISGTQVMMF